MVTNPSDDPPTDRAARIAALITEDFLNGSFNLSGRKGAPPRVGWEMLPEHLSIEGLRQQGASPVEIRRFITLMAAMDRARDADRLWSNGVALFSDHRWAFDPTQASRTGDLQGALKQTGVSQRHGDDSAAWRRILRALSDPKSPAAVRKVIDSGQGDAIELLSSVTALDQQQLPWFPLLRGPKISVMGVRILASSDTGTSISNLSVLRVAVDTQVQKVTEYLGITDTAGAVVDDSVRRVIQNAWQLCEAAAVGPTPLNGTGAALDPALWFFGKWGCTFCEHATTRLPIGRACTYCRFPAKTSPVRAPA